MAHNKVNTNDMLQLTRPFKALSLDWCMLCRGSGETSDHLFLHCPFTLGLWHRLFIQARMMWVQPRSYYDMLTIFYMASGNSTKGKTLWRIACLTLIWMMWQERNARIFEDKWRMFKTLWDLFYFFTSLCASCTDDFKGIPLNVIQLIQYVHH